MKEPDRYWGTLPEYSADFAAATIARFDESQERLKTSRLHQRMRRSWMMYYSRNQDSNCDETDIQTGGEREELTIIAPNRYRRLIQDKLNLVQQTPADYEPEAINTDPESKSQCKLALSILDQYKRVAHLEDIRNERTEIASVLSVSYLHVRWDPERGDVHGMEDVAAPTDGASPLPDAAATAPQRSAETEPVQPQQREVYKGDLTFNVRTPYDVAFAPTAANRGNPPWWIVKEPANRWDMLAQFGGDSEEIAEAIRSADKWSNFARTWDYEQTEYLYDDMIAVYWVYHERSRSCPEGRKSLVLNGKIVLLDMPLDEDRAGVFRLTESDVIFRPEGHTANFDGMPVLKAYQAQMTTVLSNESNFGLTRILNARAANMKTAALGTGLGRVDYDHFDQESGQPVPEPHVMQLNGTQPTSFEFAASLKEEADAIMGGSPTLRGDPSATKGDSGAKSAMLFAAAQAATSGLVRAVLRSDEEVATFIISSVRRHATVPRLVSIVGKNNTFSAQEFVGKDVAQIARVNVRQPNPARDTFAGRMQQAEMLLQLPPDQREEMQQLLLTGRIETVTDKIDNRKILIDRENEALRDPAKPMPIVVATDQHHEHFASHADAETDPAVRNDPEIAKRFTEHNMQHIAALTPGAPGFAGNAALLMTGQQPLPVQPPPGALPLGAQPPSGATPQHGAPAAQPHKLPDQGQPADHMHAGMPKMPINPTNGERAPLPVPDAPQVGGAL